MLHPCHLILTLACLLPLAAASWPKQVEAIHSDVVALDQAIAKRLAALPGGAKPTVLRLTLPKAILTKDIEIELRQQSGTWLPGRAWIPAINHTDHAATVESWTLDGDSKKGKITTAIRLLLRRGEGWQADMVAQMRFADFNTVEALVKIEGRCFDGKLEARYQIAYPPLPQLDRGQKHPPRPDNPYPKGKHDLRGTLTTVSGPLPVAHATLPADWRTAADVACHRIACDLEERARRNYQLIRATYVAEQTGWPLAQAIQETRTFAFARPPLIAKAKDSTPKGKKPIAVVDDDDDDLGLGDDLDELDALAEDDEPELDAKTSKRGLAELSSIAKRVSRMRQHVQARLTTAPTAVPRGATATADPHFGPWYGETPLPITNSGNTVPKVDTASALQDWPPVANWSIIGPFPRTNLDPVTPALPDILPAADDRYRLVRSELKEGGAFKANPVLQWRAAKPWAAFGFIAPPNWSDANRVYRNCPQTTFAKHTGIEHSATYGLTILNSAVAQDVWIGIGVNQLGRAWVNDQLVWATGNTADRRSAETVAVVKVHLRKGMNELLVRCDVDWNSPTWWVRVCTKGAPRDEATAQNHVAAIDKKLDALTPLTERGWRTNYTGDHDTEAPLAWHYKDGHNVAWQTSLPYWSNSTPVVTADRVFVTVEPDLLYCLDKKDGKILWHRQVSVLQLLPDGLKAEGRALYDRWVAARIERDAVPADILTPEKWIQKTRWYWDEAVASRDERANAPPELITLLDRRDELKGAPDPVAVQDDLAAVEKQIESWYKKNPTPESKEAEAKKSAMREAWNAYLAFLREHCRVESLRGYWFDYDGYAFATPVSDGTHVWCKTGHGAVGCFDLEGNQVWMQRTEGAASGSPTIPSPLLVDNKLIIKLPYYPKGKKRKKGVRIWAVAPLTGKTLWDVGDLPSSGWNASTPAVVRLNNGSDAMTVIVTGGGSILRLDDGKVLARQIGTMSGDASISVWRDHLFFARPVHTGVQLIMQDRDHVGFKRLWTQANGSKGISYGGTFVSDGIVYHAGGSGPRGGGGAQEAWSGANLTDARTGAVIDIVPLQRKGGNSWSLHSGSRDHVLFVGGDGLFSKANPKPPSHLTLLSRGRQPIVVARNVIDRTYAAPVIDGNRLYLRGYGGVTCIGHTGADGQRYEAESVVRTITDDLPTAPISDAEPLTPKPRGRVEPTARLADGQGPDLWWMLGPFPAAQAAEARAALGSSPKPDPETKVLGKAWAPLDNKVRRLPGIHPWNVDPGTFLDVNHHRRTLDLAAVSGGKDGDVVFLYAELTKHHRRPPKTWRWDHTDPQAQAWIAGQPLAHGQRVTIAGSTGLLVQTPASTSFSPRFWLSNDVAKERQRHAQRQQAALPYLKRFLPKVADPALQKLGQHHLKAP